MEKFIEVHDDILSEAFVDHIENTMMGSKTKLSYFYNDSNFYPTDHPNYEFNPGMAYQFLNFNNCGKWLGYFSHILYTFCLKQDILIYEYYKARCFLDFPSGKSAPVLPPHNDLDIPHWVCLYYANDSEGDTIFYNENNEVIKQVSPKKGRIIFFDGSIDHTGSSSVNTVRALVNFNFIGEKL